MLEHTVEQIEQTQRYFQDSSFPFNEIHIEGRTIRFFELPQEFNADLPDFVYRVTNRDSGMYVMGISNRVPKELQPYFILEEYIEFMEKGINLKNRVVEAEREVIGLIPISLKKEYLERRIKLFARELELDAEQPDKYALEKDGRKEFENNLAYLRQELDNSSK